MESASSNFKDKKTNSGRNAWTTAALAGLTGAIAAFGVVQDARAAEKGTGSTKGQCVGANECKGQSACATSTGNSCGGANECAGKGMVYLTKDQCDAKAAAQRAKAKPNPKSGAKDTAPVAIVFIPGNAM